MQVRLVINDAKIPTVGLFGTGEDQAKPCVNVWFKVQRKKLDTTGKGEWEGIPAELGNTQKTVDIYEYRNGIDKAPESVATRTQIEVADDETGHNYNNCRVQIKRKFIYTDYKYLDKKKSRPTKTIGERTALVSHATLASALRDVTARTSCSSRTSSSCLPSLLRLSAR